MSPKNRRLLLSHLVRYMDQLQREFAAGLIERPDYTAALDTFLQQVCEQIEVIDDPRLERLVHVKGPGGETWYIACDHFGVDLEEAERRELYRSLSRMLGYVLVTNYLEFHWYIKGDRAVGARLGRRVRPGGRPSLLRIPGGAEDVARLLGGILPARARSRKARRNTR